MPRVMSTGPLASKTGFSASHPSVLFRLSRPPRILIAVLTALTVTCSTAEPARSQNATCGSVAGFEIDGNLITNGQDDWADSCGSAGGNAIFLNAARQPNPILVDPAVSFRDADWGGKHQDPTAFSGGSNRNDDDIGAGQHPWVTSSGSGQPRTDLTDIYLTSRFEFIPGPPSETVLWLIFGGATRSDNGDVHVDFEFNRAGITEVPGPPGLLVGNGPQGGRSTGDAIISVDYGFAGANPRLTVHRWQLTSPGVFGWVDVTPTLAGSSYLCVDTGGSPAGPWGGVAPDGSPVPPCGAMAPFQFFEGAVQLTLAGTEPIPCGPVPSLLVKTRSSDSFTSALQDYALRSFSETTSIQGPDAVCSSSPLSAATRGPIISVYNATSSLTSNFSWSISGDGTISGATTGSSITVEHGKAGTFRLVASALDSQGQCIDAADKVVTVVSGPTVTVSSTTTCASDTPRLCANVSSGALPFSYVWDTGDTTACIATTGTHTVTVTDGCGDTATGAGTATAVVCSISGPDQICDGSSAQLCSTPGMVAYLWNTGAKKQCITVKKPGTYSVTITDASGCQRTCSHDLTVTQCASAAARLSSQADSLGPESSPSPTPNPFGSQLRISGFVPGSQSQPVVVAVYDVRGRLVRTLAQIVRGPGRFDVSWDGRNEHGDRVSSGVYIVVRRIADRKLVNRIVFLRP
jgi:flagellar hook capping protein FlgD